MWRRPSPTASIARHRSNGACHPDLGAGRSVDRPAPKARGEGLLDKRPNHTAPAARFRNELEDYMTESYADDTLKTIIS